MGRIVMLALAVGSLEDPPGDGRAVFALLQRYHASIRDVSFVYEGRFNQLSRTAGTIPIP